MKSYDSIQKTIVTNTNNKILLCIPKQKDRRIPADSVTIKLREVGYINNSL